MMPRSELGKWAGRSLALFLVLVTTLVLGLTLRKLPPGTPIAIVLGTCTMITGIATFVTGVVSLARLKDRSFVVILAIAVGSIAILLLGMETVEMIGGLVGGS